MLNLSLSSVVPFKDQINSFEWTKFFKALKGFKYKIENQELVLEEINRDEFQQLEIFFSNLSIPFKKIEDPRSLVFSKMIFIPTITENIFFQILTQFYFWNSSDYLQSFCPFINTILSDYASHIRIISSSQHSLKVIIESIKRNISFVELQPIYDELMKNSNWSDIIKDSKFKINFRTISINMWLHVLRNPIGSKSNLVFFLQHLSRMTGLLPYIVTNIPLIDPKGRYIFSLTYLDPEILQQPTLNPDDTEIKEIIMYWLTLGSLVLRNINYALLKFNNLSLEGFNHEDIEFYEYIKPKIAQFTESCYNPDLIETFKQYDSPRQKLLFNAIRGHDLFTYNRSTILEFHLKKAQQEFKQFPEKKIIRKRVNRRSNKLYSFLNDIIFIYKDFLNEISKFTKASGNYSSLDKLLKMIEI